MALVAAGGVIAAILVFWPNHLTASIGCIGAWTGGAVEAAILGISFEGITISGRGIPDWPFGIGILCVVIGAFLALNGLLVVVDTANEMRDYKIRRGF